MNPIWLAVLPFLLEGNIIGSFGRKPKRKKNTKATFGVGIPERAIIKDGTIILPPSKTVFITDRDLHEWQRLKNLNYWKTIASGLYGPLFKWQSADIPFVIYNGKLHHADSPRIIKAIEENLPESTPFESPFRNTGLSESEFNRLVDEVKEQKSLEPIKRFLASGSFAKRRRKTNKQRLFVAPMSSLGKYNDDKPRFYSTAIHSEFSIGELDDKS